jgi:nucleoside 2-deoxyribosyltransferase
MLYLQTKVAIEEVYSLNSCLDGSQVDNGTSWEIGYFSARKSPEQKIIGIRTDFRLAGESEGAVVNAMIECSCDWIVRSRKELMGAVSDLL